MVDGGVPSDAAARPDAEATRPDAVAPNDAAPPEDRPLYEVQALTDAVDARAFPLDFVADAGYGPEALDEASRLVAVATLDHGAAGPIALYDDAAREVVFREDMFGRDSITANRRGTVAVFVRRLPDGSAETVAYLPDERELRVIARGGWRGAPTVFAPEGEALVVRTDVEEYAMWSPSLDAVVPLTAARPNGREFVPSPRGELWVDRARTLDGGLRLSALLPDTGEVVPLATFVGGTDLREACLGVVADDGRSLLFAGAGETPALTLWSRTTRTSFTVTEGLDPIDCLTLRHSADLRRGLVPRRRALDLVAWNAGAATTVLRGEPVFLAAPLGDFSHALVLHGPGTEAETGHLGLWDFDAAALRPLDDRVPAQGGVLASDRLAWYVRYDESCRAEHCPNEVRAFAPSRDEAPVFVHRNATELVGAFDDALLFRAVGGGLPSDRRTALMVAWRRAPDAR